MELEYTKISKVKSILERWKRRWGSKKRKKKKGSDKKKVGRKRQHNNSKPYTSIGEAAAKWLQGRFVTSKKTDEFKT